MNREHRNLLLDGQLVLISPYDPSAGFNTGHAMERNKLVYALADASLVVSSKFNEGGTWYGAIEQLDKLKFVPVYVRSTGKPSAGLDALRSKGAIPWPNPEDADEFERVFDVEIPVSALPEQTDLDFFANDRSFGMVTSPSDVSETILAAKTMSEPTQVLISAAHNEKIVNVVPEHDLPDGQAPEIIPIAEDITANTSPLVPADTLFAAVKNVMQEILRNPMKDAEIATVLGVTTKQAKVWLVRLVDEGVIEKKKNPAAYIVKQSGLFE